MSACSVHAEMLTEVAGIRWNLDSSVDEIVDSVLDAADQEILEDIGDQRGTPKEEAPELLRQLMADVLRRYQERQRCRPAGPRGEAGE